MKLIYIFAWLVGIVVASIPNGSFSPTKIETEENRQYSSEYKVFLELRNTVKNALPDVLNIARNAMRRAVSDVVGGNVDPDKTYLVYFGERDFVPSDSNYILYSDSSPPVWSISLTGALLVRLETKLSIEKLNKEYGIYKCEYECEVYSAKNKLKIDPHRLYNIIENISLDTELWKGVDKFWAKQYENWKILAKVEFIRAARRAKMHKILSACAYKKMMKGISADISLKGPITMDIIKKEFKPKIKSFFLDVNGYQSSDMITFIIPQIGYVVYIPTYGLDYDLFLHEVEETTDMKNFYTFKNQKELALWVINEAKTLTKSIRLKAHFSLYNRKDGTFYTGVDNGLWKLSMNRWRWPNVNHQYTRRSITIEGDPFEAMAYNISERSYSDLVAHYAPFVFDAISVPSYFALTTRIAGPFVAVGSTAGLYTTESLVNPYVLKVPTDAKKQRQLQTQIEKSRDQELLELFGGVEQSAGGNEDFSKIDDS